METRLREGQKGSWYKRLIQWKSVWKNHIWVVVCILDFWEMVSQLQEVKQEMTRKIIVTNDLKKSGVTKMAEIDANNQNHGTSDYEKKLCS